MRRMDEYLAVAEQGGIKPEAAVFVRDEMAPTRTFVPTEAQGILARMLLRLTAWYVKRQSRLKLYDLSPQQLADIGLSRMEADEEARKARLSRWTRSF